ncbi:hypothetical protein B566_EDAN013943 [Ephemera danica]|nr:hypothetical protein B566_EDAN013943 [Ephemera danica]
MQSLCKNHFLQQLYRKIDGAVLRSQNERNLDCADLSCRNTKTTVGAVYTRTNFVTLKYVTDAWGTENNGFKLTITAVKDKSE